jgi:GT2 family glycosyltransferase
MRNSLATAVQAAPYTVSCSLVLYRNRPELVRAVLESLRATPCEMQICVVDNSPTSALQLVVEPYGAQYVHDPSNPGFGASHNRAFRELAPAEFHLVVNPDVYFPPETLPSLMDFLRERPDAGLASPRVLFPNGQLQHLCKRYPSLLVLFGRRFLPRGLHFLLERRLEQFEMRDVGYDDVMEQDCATGCFMLFRREAYAQVGGFDDRFFLYFEDADISLRVAKQGYKVFYYPDAHVFHHWARGAHKSWRLTAACIRSSFRFFSKHRWKLV